MFCSPWVGDPGWVEGCGKLGEAPPAFPAEVASLSGERVASWAMLFVVVDASRRLRANYSALKSELMKFRTLPMRIIS